MIPNTDKHCGRSTKYVVIFRLPKQLSILFVALRQPVGFPPPNEKLCFIMSEKDDD